VPYFFKVLISRIKKLYIRSMEKGTLKKVLLQFVIFLGVMGISVHNIYKGIAHHDTFAIAMAYIFGVIFLCFVVLIIYTLVKSRRQAF
jgi:hypothetical protein